MLPLRFPLFPRRPSGFPADSEKRVKTPFYYARKRLLNNKPALAGLIFTGGCAVLALMGYLLMPDATPYANDGAVQIQKQGPGFRVQMLKLRKNADVPKVNGLERLLFGQESAYTLVPVTAYRIEDLTVVVTPYGSKGKEVPYSILDAVVPLYVGASPKMQAGSNFRVAGDQIRYLDANETVRILARADLLREFRANHLETRRYWLGTDKAGRDMLSRLLFGLRISLGIGFMAALISLLVGVGLGSLAGFFGGRVDHAVMWLMTVVWSIPSIMLVIAISMALQSRGVWVAFVAVGLTTWVEIARVVRGQLLGLKQQLFIEAARSLGMGHGRIIVRHLLPNMLGPLLVMVTANFATAILTEAGLSFLGLGVQPPVPSWGMMVHEGFNAIGSRGSTYLVLFPSLCISLLVLAFNLLGNGLRDALDPNTRLK
ncbi:MAG: ABC transporter permease [Ferruginibacter sp.]|nr:ABC transporter permease [Cytophagales bacterium]